MTEITLRRASLAQIHAMALRSEILLRPAVCRGASHGRHAQSRTAPEKIDPRTLAVRRKTRKV
ncbi:hypothetical protein ABLE93_17205 [Xanthobacter sp. KR7-65]|uniref:hypothetical protein n=1 Tax=Xanthobacter sp. KR7-65 TaxID=3156612 RepID=UPI0032B472A4